MKRLIFLMLALLVAGSASAATKVQVMTDGVIDVDKLPTITFKQDGDPANATDGQLWYNNATNQIKVRDGGMVYHWNATGSAEYDDGSVTYLVDEDFEGTGTPSGWTLGAGANPDYSTAPLTGAQSLQFGTTSAAEAHKAISTSADVLYVHFTFSYSTAMNTSGIKLFHFRNSSDAELLGINYRATSGVNSFFLRVGANTSSLSASPAGVGEKMHVWLVCDFANDTITAYVGSTTTRPGTALITYTNTLADATPASFYMYGWNSAGTSLVDDVMISEEEFTTVQ